MPLQSAAGDGSGRTRLVLVFAAGALDADGMSLPWWGWGMRQDLMRQGLP
jgi:hypothetical protein